MYSRTSGYALQAVVFLAQHEADWPLTGRAIAEETGIPAKYLASVLGRLARERVLLSSPGAHGGFRLARSSRDIRLIQVLEPFEPLLSPRDACPFGNEECSDANPCAGHDEWAKVREAYHGFLRETSVFDVSVTKRKTRRKKR